MLIFFINGYLTVTLTPENIHTSDTDLYTYNMSFLSEASQDTLITLQLQDINNNTISQDLIVDSRATAFNIDVTDFAYKYNWQDSSYNKITYKVLDSHQNILYTGSFPIITPTHNQSLKIAAVSCNNNQNSYDLNDYNYKYANSSLNMWDKLNNKKVDIIFHLGNQIYADYIVSHIGYKNNNCNIQEIYDAYANLYRTAYSEKYQGETMRNSLNIMILGEHDIAPNFGTLTDKEDLYFKAFYLMGMKAFAEYQMFETNQNKIDNILKGDYKLYFNINYGQYTFIGLDSRYELYNNKTLFSPEQINFVNNNIAKTLNTKIYLLSSRPIGDLNEYNALISNSTEDLFHTFNINFTLRLLNNLDYINQDRSKDIILLSGGVEKTYTNYILINNNVLLSQLVVGSITRKPLIEYNMFEKIKKYIQHKFTFFCEDNIIISDKENYYTSNSLGYIINNIMFSLVDGTNIVKETNNCFMNYN